MTLSAEITNISIETESQMFTFHWNNNIVLTVDVNNFGLQFLKKKNIGKNKFICLGAK